MGKKRGSYPRSLEELAKAGKAKPKHKQMRKWKQILESKKKVLVIQKEA